MSWRGLSYLFALLDFKFPVRLLNRELPRSVLVTAERITPSRIQNHADMVITLWNNSLLLNLDERQSAKQV